MSHTRKARSDLHYAFSGDFNAIICTTFDNLTLLTDSTRKPSLITHTDMCTHTPTPRNSQCKCFIRLGCGMPHCMSIIFTWISPLCILIIRICKLNKRRESFSVHKYCHVPFDTNEPEANKLDRAIATQPFFWAWLPRFSHGYRVYCRYVSWVSKWNRVTDGCCIVLEILK